MTKISRFNLARFNAIIFFSFLINAGCQNQDYIDNQDYEPAITNSPELEDYIIAAADLQQSTTIFERELAKVNFANLETVINSDGKKVTYLPVSIRSLNIEQKVLRLNTKKDILFNKYPQFTSLDLNDITNYIDRCISESMRVNSYFLENSINAYRPLTRTFFNESYDNTNSLVGHLYNWTLSPDYVEVFIIFYKNGTSTVVLDPKNTPNEANIVLAVMNNKYYYPSASSQYEIQSVSHTHRSSNNPSGPDQALKKNYPGLESSIYYNGAFHSY